jgi:transposase
MRFYRGVHQYYCGIDLHARTMYLCITDNHGTILLHESLPCQPAAFFTAIRPYMDDLVVTAECIFCWYWLADLCQQHSIKFVLAHALYLKAIHGGKTKNDRLDSEKLAVLLRGGVIPQAYVYPPELRPTRDLLRRRLFFTRKRAELLSHIQNTFHQYNLSVPAAPLLRRKHRDGVAERFTDPIVRKTVEADLLLCASYDERIKDLEKTVEREARDQEPHALFLLQTIHGVGRILALTIPCEIHTIDRFPRVQDFSSYCRLVKATKTSAGKPLGTSGAKIGNAHLKWAFSEAAVCFLHNNPRGLQYKRRLQRRYGKGKSLSVLAAKLGRATYFMLKQKRPFDMDRFLVST